MKLFDYFKVKYLGVALCHAKQEDETVCQKVTKSAWGIIFFRQNSPYPPVHSQYPSLPEK